MSIYFETFWRFARLTWINMFFLDQDMIPCCHSSFFFFFRPWKCHPLKFRGWVTLGFSTWSHIFQMAVMASFRAEKCCHQVIARATSVWRICSSVRQLPTSTSVYSSWSIVHSYLFVCLISWVTYIQFNVDIHRDWELCMKCALYNIRDWNSTVVICLFDCIFAVDFGVSAQLDKTIGKRNTFIGTPYWWDILTGVSSTLSDAYVIMYEYCTVASVANQIWVWHCA